MKTKYAVSLSVAVFSLLAVSLFAETPPQEPQSLPVDIKVVDGGDGTLQGIGEGKPVEPSYDVNVLGPKSPFYITMYPLDGPYSTNAGFANWASNVVWGKILTGSVTNTLGTKFVTTDIVQPTDYSTNTVWFMVEVEVADTNTTFTPDMMSFVAMSTDTGNTLGKTTVMNTPSFQLSPWAVMTTHTPNGDINSTSGFWNQTPGHRFTFIGSMSKFYVGDPNAIFNYLNSFLDFQIIARWSINVGGTNYFAAKTLHFKGGPSPAFLRERVEVAGQSLSLYLDTAGSNDTYTTFFSPSAISPVWTRMGTLNPGESIPWTGQSGTNLGKVGFFKATLQ